MNSDQARPLQISRRAFVQGGTLAIAASAGVAPARLFASPREETLRAGLITDLHYADKDPAGSRHYRETLPKIREAAQLFAERGIDFVLELGDLIDAAPSVDTELGYLATINREFREISPNRHYVLGNHCVDTLHKEEFLGEVGQEKSFYSFDTEQAHFVILDACFRSDGVAYGRRNFEWTDPNIPAGQLEWLKADLAETSKPVVVFVHQRLDVDNNHGIKNAAEVRKILEASDNVNVVFQGHSHKNDLKEIGGIHYCTLVAMVEGTGDESSGYSLLEIDESGTIRVEGFRNQAGYPR